MKQNILLQNTNYNENFSIKAFSKKTINIFDLNNCSEIKLSINCDENSVIDLNIYSISTNDTKKNICVNLNHNGDKSNSQINFFGVSFGSSKINVKLDSFVTNSNQSLINQTITGLILSNNSNITGKPILRVKEKNTIVNHALSIGAIDEETIFYLKSKCLNEKQIYNLIINSNFEKILVDLKPNTKLEIQKKIKEIIHANW